MEIHFLTIQLTVDVSFSKVHPNLDPYPAPFNYSADPTSLRWEIWIICRTSKLVSTFSFDYGRPREKGQQNANVYRTLLGLAVGELFSYSSPRHC